MADERVRDVQNWLNNTYGSNANWVQVDADGQTGFYTVKALVRALQIELGIEVDGTFGNGTKNGFNTRFPNGLSKNTDATEQSTKNIIAIVNGGFWCRGIEGEVNDRYVFGNYTEAGVILMKSQLGILQPTGEIKAREMKAILTTDAYTLTSNGNANVREIQQQINRRYINVFGSYIATNGIYERNMNTAIIKAIQYEIGVEVDGGWGEGTKSSLPVLGPGSSRTNLVYILQYLLYLNGFDPNGFDGGFGNGVTTALKAFQTLMKLDVDGYCGRQAWSALVVSCGDTARSATACDTRFEITPERAQVLKDNGYEIVGRYLTGGDFKELREGELEVILNAGLKAFVIYQDNNRLISDFSYEQGVRAAIEASTAARNKKVPQNTIIYFAVDLDVYEDQIADYIIPFFEGIKNFINFRYKVGIYGPRLVCERVANANLAESSFVSDMSSGYSCNIGQKIPSNWNYDQFKEISNFNNDFDIDKVTYRGLIEPISYLETGIEDANADVINFIKEVYEAAKVYYMGTHNDEVNIANINAIALQYLAHTSDYTTSSWNTLAGYDEIAVQYMENQLGTDRRESLTIYNKDYNKSITLPHLAISTYMIFARTIGILTIDYVVSDLSGWAGDLLSYASDLADMQLGQIPSNLDEQVANIIGSENSAVFSTEDFIQDLDAWNLYEALEIVPIYSVFNNYYNTTRTKRAEKFIENRMEYSTIEDGIDPDSSDLQKVYGLAKLYLCNDMSKITYWAGLGFDMLLHYEMPISEVQDKIALGFAKKVVQMLEV